MGLERMLALWGVTVGLRHGYERRFVVTYANIALVGAGSVAFHGTLTHVGQQGDETPMIFSAVRDRRRLSNPNPVPKPNLLPNTNTDLHPDPAPNPIPNPTQPPRLTRNPHPHSDP